MAAEVHDLCVIGAGMFGSAAARHASANPSIKVCLVGPSEPTPEELPKRDIFGSYYDEGRITRILDDLPASVVLSRHSISRYRELEKLSGIKFYEPVGCFYTGPRNDKFIRSVIACAAACKVPFVKMEGNGETFKNRYPYLKLENDEIALLEDAGGGHINPRHLEAAQKRVARLQGCHIIESIVCGVETLGDGTHVVKTESKGEIRAKRLLIATGGFVNLKSMSVLKPLVVKRMKETIVLFELPDDEVQRLSSMPPMISVRGTSRGIYILPPIKYPDGKYYLKYGKLRFQEENDEVLKTLDEMRDWYVSDGDSELETYIPFLTDLIPGLKYNSLHRRTCATCNTPSGLPYIDRVSPTVTVAVGGNARGARFSDEVGRIAAHLTLTGKWDSELSQGLFEAAFQ